jgi:hypothetical protein
MQAATAHSASVVRFPANRARKAKASSDTLAGLLKPWATGKDRPERERAAAEKLDQLLSDLEAPTIDDAARQRLRRLTHWHGPQHVTLLIRTIIESEGNENALVEPIISAVSSVMSSHRDWTEKGLAWIEAFDSISLIGIVETMRSLDLFRESSL